MNSYQTRAKHLFYQLKYTPLSHYSHLMRTVRIELTSRVYETPVLPLNYILCMVNKGKKRFELLFNVCKTFVLPLNYLPVVKKGACCKGAESPYPLYGSVINNNLEATTLFIITIITKHLIF